MSIPASSVKKSPFIIAQNPPRKSSQPFNPARLISRLLLDIKGVTDRSDFKIIYKNLSDCLPNFQHQDFQVLLEALPDFLKKSHLLKREQMILAKQLGDWCKLHQKENESFSTSVDAIDFYAKAKRMAQHQKDLAFEATIDQEMSAFLERFAKSKIEELNRENRLKNKLQSLMRSSKIEDFRNQLQQIEDLKLICCKEKNLTVWESLYDQATEVLVYDVKGRFSLSDYQPIISKIAENRKIWPDLVEPSSRRYPKAVQQYRKIFDRRNDYPDLREFQKEATRLFIDLIHLFLKDTFAIMGLPPCEYDLRAMGSTAREEICPFSDFELMILIKSDKTENTAYFKKLVKILDLQMRLLGETASKDNPSFRTDSQTNLSGLHLDGDPNEIIKTPKKMASLQLIGQVDNATARYMTLRSIRIQTNDETLFQDFQKELTKILDTRLEHMHRRELLVHKSLQWDIKWLYKEKWKEPLTQKEFINIKEHFLQPLAYLMSNLGIYFRTKSHNTYDIVQELIEQKVFHPFTGRFIQESLLKIYQLRIKVHLNCGEQQDLVVAPSHRSDTAFYKLNEEEYQALDRIFNIAIQPLYELFDRLIKSKGSIEIYFKNYDLIKAYLIHSIPLNEGILALRYAKSLTGFKLTYETHEEYYKLLADRSKKEDELREFYLEDLELDTKARLESVPDLGGFRQSTRKRELDLVKGLMEMTTSQPPGKDSPQVCIIKAGWEDPRFLCREVTQQIIDFKSGRIKKSYEGSAHNVTRSRYKTFDMHFKDLPTHPLMEYAIFDLTSRLYPNLTPASELIRFDVSIADKVISYPVLVSQTVEGENLKKIDTIKWEQCDQYQWTWMLLATILTSPGDGRAANYILHTSPKSTIHCIDNDISFATPVMKDMYGVKSIMFCSALFCYSLGFVLDRRALLEFCKLDVEMILYAWMNRVIAKEEQYLKLFTKSEQEKLYSLEQQQFKAEGLFRQGSLATLKVQFYHLKNFIEKIVTIGGDVKVANLLQQIIGLTTSIQNVGPYVFDQYDKAIRLKTITERLSVITNRSQDRSLTSQEANKATLGSVPTFAEIQSRKLYSASEAKKEISSVIHNQNLNMLLSTNNSFLKANFHEIESESRQLMVLESVALLPTRPKSISINYCKILNGVLLEKILHKDLESLELSFCLIGFSGLLECIQKMCPALKELTLTGCQELTSFAITWLLVPAPIEFPELKILKIDECPKLEIVKLKAPKLEVLLAKKNPLLKYFEFDNLSAKVDLTGCPRISTDILNKYKYTFIKLLRKNNSLTALPPCFEKDEEVILAAARKFDWAIKYAPANKQVVLAGVKKNGLIIQFAADHLKGDKDIGLAAVRTNGMALEFLTVNLQKDKEVVLAAIESDPCALKFANSEMRNDEEIVVQAIELNALCLHFASLDLRSKKELLLVAVKQNGFALEFASENLKRDKEVVLAAILQNPESQKFAHVHLMQDKSFLLNAIKQGFPAWHYRDNHFWSDREFVFETIKRAPLLLAKADNILQKDRQIVLEAVSREGEAIRYADRSLQEDREIGLLAVKKKGSNLAYLPLSLTNNYEIVLAAVSNNGHALGDAGILLKKDERLTLAALKQCGKMLNFQNDEIKKNRECVMAAVEQDGLALQYADSSLKEDNSVVLAAVKQNGLALQYADRNYRGSFQEVLAAVKQNGMALQYAHEIMKNESAIVLEAVKQNSQALQFASEDLKNNKEFARQIVSMAGECLQFFGDEIRKDRDVVLNAVRHTSEAFPYAPEYSDDLEIVFTAIRKDGRALRYVSKELQTDKKMILDAIKHWKERKGYDQYLSKNNRNDTEFMLEVVQYHGEALAYAKRHVRNNPRVVLAALQNYPKSIVYTTLDLQENRSFVLEAFKINPHVFPHFLKEFQNDKEIALMAVAEDGLLLKYVSFFLRSDRDVVIKAVQQNSESIRFATYKLRNDPVILAALKK